MTDQSAPAWTPFQRVAIDASEFDTPEAHARYEALAKQDPNPQHDAAFYKATYMSLLGDEHYTNSRYHAIIRRTNADNGEGGVVEMVHISVKRHDREVIHDWRDMQRIKNELLGPNCEAVELYPATDREVDTANQYHMWGVNDPNFRWPVGWNEGRQTLDGSDVMDGVGQRPFEVDLDLSEVKTYNYPAMWERLKKHLEAEVASGNGDQRLVDWMDEIEEDVETLS